MSAVSVRRNRPTEPEDYASRERSLTLIRNARHDVKHKAEWAAVVTGAALLAAIVGLAVYAAFSLWGP